MTEEKPKRVGTKHHIVRIDDDRWHRLQELAKQIVTTSKPLRARADSTWQLTEMLRLLADGKLAIYKKEDIDS